MKEPRTDTAASGRGNVTDTQVKQQVAEIYKNLVEALNGFGGKWSLPPLNRRAETTGGD